MIPKTLKYTKPQDPQNTEISKISKIPKIKSPRFTKLSSFWSKTNHGVKTFYIMYTKNDFLTTLPGILFTESVHNTFMEWSFGSVIKKWISRLVSFFLEGKKQRIIIGFFHQKLMKVMLEILQKPYLSIQLNFEIKLYIKLLNCFVLEHTVFKTKHFRSFI